ncbi:hypothetical protein ACFXJ8_23320 [Nonomuraea sp. NPDC059194]
MGAFLTRGASVNAPPMADRSDTSASPKFIRLTGVHDVAAR